MVVTDLHGDWEAYQLYRDLFIRGYQAGDIQYLIFTGDLIHRESSLQHDKSLEIVLDVLKLQETYPDTIIYLCGNHEFPHIHHVTLTKNGFNYTANFEACLGNHRSKVIGLFKSLPFYVRTSAGVAITHVGAAAPLNDEQNCYRIFSFEHQEIFDRIDQILAGKDLEGLCSSIAKFSGEPYQVQVRNYLAVTERDDPRYHDLLRGFIASGDPNFKLLWTVLFTRCEQEYDKGDYGTFLNTLLQALSVGFHPQKFLVAGHIDVKGGYQVIIRRHLRIASGKHALPEKSARCLMFDVARRIRSARHLVSQLRSASDLFL